MKITLDSYNGAAIRQDCSQSMHLKETDEQFEPAEGKWLTAEELLLSIIAHKCQILLTKYE